MEHTLTRQAVGQESPGQFRTTASLYKERDEHYNYWQKELHSDENILERNSDVEVMKTKNTFASMRISPLRACSSLLFPDNEHGSNMGKAIPNEKEAHSGRSLYRANNYGDRIECSADCSQDGYFTTQQNKENESPSLVSQGRCQLQEGLDRSSGFHTVDDKLKMLARSLEAVETRCDILSVQAEDADQRALCYAQQIAEKEITEKTLRAEISRLRGVVEAQKMANNVAEETLRTMLGVERSRVEHLTLERDAAVSSRSHSLLSSAYVCMGWHGNMAAQGVALDFCSLIRMYRIAAVVELGETAEDMQEMQAMLAACAAYCNELELNLKEMRKSEEAHDAFNLQKLKSSIQEAVMKTGHMPEDERKKELKKLLLRWHPDKNPMLKELASEVTKLINEAASNLYEDSGA